MGVGGKKGNIPVFSHGERLYCRGEMKTVLGYGARNEAEEVDLCECKSSLVYIVSPRTIKVT